MAVGPQLSWADRSLRRCPGKAREVLLVDVKTHTVERWVKNAAETCLGEIDDIGWSFSHPMTFVRHGDVPR